MSCFSDNKTFIVTVTSSFFTAQLDESIKMCVQRIETTSTLKMAQNHNTTRNLSIHSIHISYDREIEKFFQQLSSASNLHDEQWNYLRSLPGSNMVHSGLSEIHEGEGRLNFITLWFFLASKRTKFSVFTLAPNNCARSIPFLSGKLFLHWRVQFFQCKNVDTFKKVFSM